MTRRSSEAAWRCQQVQGAALVLRDCWQHPSGGHAHRPEWLSAGLLFDAASRVPHSALSSSHVETHTVKHGSVQGR